MIYLILSIVISSSLLVIFKYFDKYDVQPVMAIAVNYAVAAIVGSFFVDFSTPIQAGDTPWIVISIGLGILFSIIFNLSKFTTTHVGMGITSVAMKLGVLFPVLIGIFCYGESFQLINYIGLIIGMLSIYFINKRKDSEHNLVERSILILPLLVWIGSGACDSAVQLIQKKFPIPASNGLFSFITFASAAGSSFIYLLYKKVKWENKNVLGGIILGIPNYFSIYFLVKSLEVLKKTHQIESSNLFMINNLSIVICSVTIGVQIFRERLSKLNYFGIFLSLLSLYFIQIK